MKDAFIHSDWLPIPLPDDVAKLREMLVCQERFGGPGAEMTEPIRRKIARLEQQQKNKEK